MQFGPGQECARCEQIVALGSVRFLGPSSYSPVQNRSGAPLIRRERRG